MDETMTVKELIKNIETKYYKKIDDYMVSYDGNFLYKGKKIKIQRPVSKITGRKLTARLRAGGKYIQAAKLVAKAYILGFKDENYIIYKDGDIHNISADNLKIVDKKQYYTYLLRNSYNRAKSIEERLNKLNIIIEEANLTKDFLLNRDFSKINSHVQLYLIPVLKDYCIKTIHVGINNTQKLVPEVLAILYEVIDNDMCIYNYERYLKKLLLNWKKKGSFGVIANIPNPVHDIINNLNLDCLCERYKVTKL